MSQPLPPAIHNTQFPVEMVRQYLENSYELSGPLTCEFLRRGFNDHYLITTPNAKHIFRIYFQGKYYISGPDDFRFELELLAHAKRQGVAVAAAVPQKNGELLGHLVGPEGTRWCALFPFIEGRENAELNPVTARRLGQTLGQYHAAADSYHTSYSRYHFDLSYLVERPMALIRNMFRYYGREVELEPFLPSIAAWQKQIHRIPLVSPAYGVIHGDPHSGNVRINERDEVTLFDFDHGGYGWRVYDVAVCRGRLSEETWEAFLGGYQETRSLTTEELEAVPAFLKIRPIWDQGDVLATIPVWGEAVPDAEFCDKIVTLFEKITA